MLSTTLKTWILNSSCTHGVNTDRDLPGTNDLHLHCIQLVSSKSDFINNSIKVSSTPLTIPKDWELIEET